MVLKGSSTGISGLTAGVSAFAPMGREAWPTDLSGFRRSYGYLPLDIRIGYDAYTGAKLGPPGYLCQREEPSGCATVEQIQRIFTSGSAKGDITHWGQLGLTGRWASREIHLYGPRDEGGFATSLRMTKLGKLPFSSHYEALPKNPDIAEAVGSDPYGIGLISFFDSAGSPAIRMVPLGAKKADQPSLASYDEVKAEVGASLSPELHIYVNRAPGTTIDPVVADYIRFALSAEGQAIVASEKDSEEGYLPLASGEIDAELAKLK